LKILYFYIDKVQTLTDTSPRENLYQSLLIQTEDIMPPDPKKLKAIQLNVEGLFKLLGGSSDDRARFWEILKGVTTPVEIRLLNAQVDALAAQAKAVQAGAKSLQTAAQQIARRG
jgi:Cu/Ag efflux pump CusA